MKKNESKSYRNVLTVTRHELSQLIWNVSIENLEEKEEERFRKSR